MRALMTRSTVAILAITWATTAWTLGFGHDLVAHPPNAAAGVLVFLVILAAIMIAAFGVVTQAEQLAERLGEPFGTLVLTLTVVVIEVALIASVMLGPGGSSTIGRDSLFAVMMIIINGVMGLAILLGGLRHGPQSYNTVGTSVYLAVITALSLCTLVLPNFTGPASDGTLTTVQSIGIALLAAALYAFFLAMQVGRDRALFVQPVSAASGTTAAVHAAGRGRTSSSATGNAPGAASGHASTDRRGLVARSVLLVVTVLPIVLLSHDLGILVDLGIEATGAPTALGGVLIAIIVFTPEAVTAIRASLANQSQRAFNLGLGAFTSTVGLTIPVILVIGLVSGQEVVLGESPANMVLIATTLAMTLITFFSLRTTAVHGAVHLMLFGVYGILLFTP
ncbi:calcium:proton antiporter [Agromyces salentinus]|uniref:Calcium:proton antiporter n=1 Tax=Agromyces salentinus TaxID=269421 RepID=A0ABN2MSP8_9MICO|nr:calcium:proton antiporter [Agromyces salentinus]